MIAAKGAALSLLLLVVLVTPGARTIEVHEEVNEGPSAEAPQPNATTAPPLVTASALPSTTALPGTVNERNVNDPTPGPPSQQQQQQRQSALHHGNADQEAAHNFTTFPSNHRLPQQQHSGTATVGHRDSASPPSRASEVAPGGPVTPTVAASVPPSASFRAANGHLQPPQPPSIGERLKGRQQQISGYRKRQLYASATQPRRNASFEQSSEAPFVPSPEVGLPYGDDSSSPMLPIQGPAYSPSAVDALFPAATPTESRWYASGNGLGAGGREYDKPTGHHRPVWVQHDPPVRSHQVVKFPQESTIALFPAPKGKWKWIPEEEEQQGEVEAPVTMAGHAPSPEEHSGFGHRHPYPFDPYRSNHQLPATVDGGTFSSDAAGSGIGTGPGNASGSAETTIGGTHKELLGKDEAHRKSVSPWKKIFHVLGAAIPIGLLISALTPQVVYINPNATLPPLTPLQTPTPISGTGLQGPGGVRQRSLDPSADRGPDPATAARLLQKLRALERDADGNGGGDESNRLQRCDWKLLCQLVHRPHGNPGLDPSTLRQMLWKLTSETTTPEWARRLGLDQILRIIRDGDCGELERTCDQDT